MPAPTPPGSIGPFKVGDRILDKWEVRGLLGKGGHAFVYDCFHVFLNKEVALKVIPPVPHRGTKLFDRARAEAQFLFEANHPNVVRVTDAGEIDGMAYIVMEKLDGSNLREMLRELGPLTLIEALTIALPIAEALEAAHAMDVIHRDLKPENIFLLPGNEVKVLDFGIAKFVHGEHPTTQRDLIQGTAPYMSPEQAQGVGITFASDIFQLGTILYEMIAGICPCMIGLEEPTQNVILAIQIGKMPPRLKAVIRSVPDHVDRLVWGAIVKDPAQRYASMSAFAQEIRNSLSLLFTQLSKDQLTIRSVSPRRPEQKTPPRRSPSGSRAAPAHLQTTPIALAASTALRVAARVGSAGTEEMPAPGRPMSPSSDAPQNAKSASAAEADRRSGRPQAPNQAVDLELAAAPAQRKAVSANAPPPRARRATAQQGLAPALAVLAAAVQHPDTVAHATPSATAQARVRESAVIRQNDHRAARRMLLRAAMIGIGLACPVGIVGGLWIRSHTPATAGPALSAAPAAQSAPAEQQKHGVASPAASAALDKVTLTPSAAAPSTPAPESSQVASRSLVEIQRDSASARRPVPPATALHSPAAVAPRPATKAPIAAPARSSASAPAKSKAAASAPAPNPVRPLIF
ncbi:MAG TPA: protein kinase [Polyangiaceae bacterium]|nr:protein kinase [Polyangiaceae bacterium]